MSNQTNFSFQAAPGADTSALRGAGYDRAAEDYYRIAEAIRFLETHIEEQPGLKAAADHLNLSEYHFQRMFTRWVGISPKRFLQYLTKERAKQLLADSASVLDASLDSGLSGPGRLHDLFVHCEAVTPGEYKSQGEGLLIRYSFHSSPFGECLLARTDRGVSNLIFIDEGNSQEARAAAVRTLQAEWPEAVLEENAQGAEQVVKRLFGQPVINEGSLLALHLRGTNFQIKVWEALLSIPAGSVVTYGDLAVAIGMPTAARAVGNAVGSNPLPVIIPCHRVIRKSGDIGNYRYGSTRKRAILTWELARREVEHV